MTFQDEYGNQKKRKVGFGLVQLAIKENKPNSQEFVNVLVERSDNPERLYDFKKIYKSLSGFKQLHISRFGAAQTDPVQLQVKSVQHFQHSAVSTWSGHKAALKELVDQAKARRSVYLYCESSAELSRVREIVQEINKRIPRNLKLVKGYIHQGFALDELNITVISHHELFGQYTLRRKPRPLRASTPVESLVDLHAGDYVVHASYGIGKFLGIKIIEDGDSKGEYLSIEYADATVIQVSVSNITLVQKYIGTSPKRPRLSKVGSKRWQKQKDKVVESVHDLALELLQVQAARQALGGFSCQADSNWQREFEESFAYQETEDQLSAITQIKTDMQSPVAMDRLLCGDVGYGKTEVAMRAAFKAIDSGKQVAVLVPTTVLSVQHGRTFTERFADFPNSFVVFIRFRPDRDQALICFMA
jgi:transcription-repair coupling factor (superfamily II helicase)